MKLCMQLTSTTSQCGREKPTEVMCKKSNIATCIACLVAHEERKQKRRPR